MSNIKKFLLTSRYNKPHGILLLFFPCIWGIYLKKTNISEEILLYIIFFIGACGMRALGCIWNDYNDKNLNLLLEQFLRMVLIDPIAPYYNDSLVL